MRVAVLSAMFLLCMFVPMIGIPLLLLWLAAKLMGESARDMNGG
jgi:hypothetical protein